MTIAGGEYYLPNIVMLRVSKAPVIEVAVPARSPGYSRAELPPSKARRQAAGRAEEADGSGPDCTRNCVVLA